MDWFVLWPISGAVIWLFAIVCDDDDLWRDPVVYPVFLCALVAGPLTLLGVWIARRWS